MPLYLSPKAQRHNNRALPLSPTGGVQPLALSPESLRYPAGDSSAGQVEGQNQKVFGDKGRGN